MLPTPSTTRSSDHAFDRGSLWPVMTLPSNQSDAGGNFSNAASRSTDIGTLSSSAPACFQVVATKVCGPENLNSADNVGAPPIMSLNGAIRFCLRL
jgi:hypothetical protein